MTSKRNWDGLWMTLGLPNFWMTFGLLFIFDHNFINMLTGNSVLHKKCFFGTPLFHSAPSHQQFLPVLPSPPSQPPLPPPRVRNDRIGAI